MKKLPEATLALALLLSACASQQQPPAPPPLKIATEAAPSPEATTPPPIGAQILAQQPADVRTALKEHQEGGKWRVYRTAERTLYSYNQEPEPTVDCRYAPQTFSCSRARPSPMLPWETRSAGWRRRPLPAIHANLFRTWR